MRLTEKNMVIGIPTKLTIVSEDGYKTEKTFEPKDKSDYIYNKLSGLEDIEDRLGLEIKDLFNYKEDPFCMLEMEMEEDDDGEIKIYFDGDSFYGRYKKENWLGLIKRMIKAYEEAWGPKRMK